jgi:hypothetical protein
MANQLFEAAKSLAAHLMREWRSPATNTAALRKRPRAHFEIRVRDGAIVVVCKTTEAFQSLPIRRVARGVTWRGVRVTVEMAT